MAQFNLADYEPVEDRIRKFYEDYPDGAIWTEIVHDDGKRIVIKTRIYRDQNGEPSGEWATGHAEEIRGEGYVNKNSALENCETSSIGRALANANYAGSKRPSREEMEKATRKDEPKPRDLSGGITDPQRKKIFALFTEKGLVAEDKQHKAIESVTGKDSISKLTTKEAGELIEALERYSGTS